MKIFDILNYTNASDIVDKITQTKPISSTTTASELKKEWDVSKHRVITDNEFLPNKEIKNDLGEVIKTKYVNRISLPFQKLIVEKTIAFGFNNGVGLEVKSSGDEVTEEYPLIDALKKVLYKNKTSTFDKKIARDLYRSKEVAEIWYVKNSGTIHKNYGFDTTYNIGVVRISGWNENDLYPVFDAYDDLVLFARGYSLRINGDLTPVYDIWTDEEEMQVIKTASGWAINKQIPNVFKKIPIVFAEQEVNEWEDVKRDIERLELLLSRHAEINDYHASPKTFIVGDLKSMPQAGEANGTINGEIGSDAKILSWNSAPESIKLEIETRLENIHKFTQIPDISFKSIKGLNQISGVMLKMLFMDAHLKVIAKNEIWNEYFSRRYNLVQSILAYLNPSSDWASVKNEIEVTPIIKPYMIEDTKELIDMALTANGNKAILSRKGAIKFAGITKDVESMLNEIETEEEKEFYKDTSEPQDY